MVGRRGMQVMGALVAFVVACASPAAMAVARCAANCGPMPCCDEDPLSNAGVEPVRECCLQKAEARSAIRSDAVRELEQTTALPPQSITLPARSHTPAKLIVFALPRSANDLYQRKCALLL